MQKGLTLIEILITLVIIAIAITPIFSMFLKSSKDIKLEKKYLQATFLAKKVMEELKYGLIIHPKIKIVVPKFKKPFDDFNCNIKKELIDNELYKLIVNINFKYGFRKHNVYLSSLYSSRYPLRIVYRKDSVWP